MTPADRVLDPVVLVDDRVLDPVVLVEDPSPHVRRSTRFGVDRTQR